MYSSAEFYYFVAHVYYNHSLLSVRDFGGYAFICVCFFFFKQKTAYES